jgi:Tol biopolymer transport system component
MVAVIAALVAVAVAAMQGDGTGSQPATMSPSDEGPALITNFYSDIATGKETPVAASLGGFDLPDVSPNGEYIAYSTCCEDDAVFVAKLDGTTFEMVTPSDLDGYRPSWIDDQTILFQGRPEGTNQLGELYTVDVSTGELDVVVDLPDERRGAWVIVSDISPDGTTVLYHLPRGEGVGVEYDLWTAPISGGEPTLLRRDAGYAAYGSDGSIAFLDHAYPFQGDELWIMDGDGEHARPLVTGGDIGWPFVSPDGTRVAFERGKGIEIVDVATGEITKTDKFAEGFGWYDDETLIV